MGSQIAKEIEKIPFLKIAVSLMAGIVMAKYINLAWWFELLSIVLCVALVFIFNRENLKSITIIILLFFTGITISDIDRAEHSAPRNKSMIMSIELTDIPGQSKPGRWLKTTARIHWSKLSTDNIKSSRERVIMHIDTALNLHMGDIITVKSTLFPIGATASGNDGYAKLMRQRGITARTYISPKNIISQSDAPIKSLLYRAKMVQKKFSDKFASAKLAPQDKAVMSALITGDRGGIDSQTNANYSRVGITHILSLSGLHLAIIFFILNILLRPMVLVGRHGYALKTILIIVLIWSYTLATGLALSMCRSAMMFTILQLSLFFDTRSNSYNALFIAAFATLIVAPSALFDLSFQLSYLAVISIIFFYPRIHRLFKPKKKFLTWIWDVTVVAIAAQIGAIPLIVYHFNQLPILTLLVNPLIMVTTPIIMVTGAIFLIFSNITLITSITSIMIAAIFKIQNTAINFTASLSFAAIEDLDLSFLGLILCYIFIIVSMIFIKQHEINQQPSTTHDPL